ncbi:MAG: tetratricopeptide repeat protein [Burkholderiaceae bacterium]|nr:tetratricopeptide repeat protein [Burkholderiales bacterium]MCZ8338454.1 tetratricopeptide repeat protein [Burkholderiaceae bacterium]
MRALPDGGPLWRRLAPIAALFIACGAQAASPDLARARELAARGDHQAAYDLLLPFEASARDDAVFNLVLGESALRTQRAEDAKRFFQRSLAAAPDSVDAHFGLARAYLALGDYASAKIEFETVLRFDDLPNDLQQQVEVYAEAARRYARGERLLTYGYVLVGYGNYRVNSTSRSVGADSSDPFFSTRFGGGVSYRLDAGYSVNGSLDYRYRNYDADRRNDSDLRWNAALSRTLGDGNLSTGVRGRVSYRGDSNYRNDFGAYGTYRFRIDEDNQVTVGGEIRQRRYPTGPLRERTRNIAEVTAGWTRSLLDGQASFSLLFNGGREFNTNRPDGDSNFIGLSPSFTYRINDSLGAFVFGLWQNDRYNIERLNIGAADEVLGIATRNDNLYEVGGGLNWKVAPGWSINPEVLYIRDQSNIIAANYSSIEIWVTLRKDF